MNVARYIAIIGLLTGLTLDASGELRTSDDEPTTDPVQAAAEELLEERFPEFASRLQVRVLRVSGSVADDASLRIRFNSSEGVPKGRTHVRIVADDGDGTDRAGWAMLYVSHYDSVGVARRDLSSGDAVHAADVGMAWLDVTTFRGHPLDRATLTRLYAGESFFTTQPIAAGDGLRAGDIRPPYAADTGATVTMTYRRGPVHLTVSCRARESGVAGDIIRLYSDATHSTYKARLTGPGEAEWIATL